MTLGGSLDLDTHPVKDASKDVPDKVRQWEADMRYLLNEWLDE